MRYATVVVVVAAAVIVLSAAADSVNSIVKYTGQLGNPAADPAFAAATSNHVKQHIDFDDDGFVLISDRAPIPTDHYAALGVGLVNLEVRTVLNPLWTHSPPIGAWHTGFD